MEFAMKCNQGEGAVAQGDNLTQQVWADKQVRDKEGKRGDRGQDTGQGQLIHRATPTPTASVRTLRLLSLLLVSFLS